jgi:UDP-glucose 6-dehydrogenase
MNSTIFRTGFIGAEPAACLTGDGSTVIGVDVNPDNVPAITNRGSSITEANHQ